jgi:hypothetical protein
MEDTRTKLIVEAEEYLLLLERVKYIEGRISKLTRYYHTFDKILDDFDKRIREINPNSDPPAPLEGCLFPDDFIPFDPNDRPKTPIPKRITNIIAPPPRPRENESDFIP